MRYRGLPAGFLVLLAGAVLLAGCGGSEPRSTGGSLSSYLAKVEPIRLGVNRLLDRADPILDTYREHRIGPDAASRRMRALAAALPGRDFADLAAAGRGEIAASPTGS